MLKNPLERFFPGGPVVRNLCFHCRGCGFNLWGTMIPNAVLYGKKTKQKLFGEVKCCQYALKNWFFLALLFFFLLHCAAWGIPTPPAMGLQCLSHWTAQEAPPLSFLSIKSKSSKLFAGVTLHFKLDIYATAKSLQSCPTLCDPIDGSPPSSPVPGTLQARILEWVAISFSNAWKWKVTVKSCPTPSNPVDCKPTRLLHPWDLPGKSTGVGCHCLLLDIYRILNLILKWYLPRPPEVRYEREQMKNNKLTFV